MEEPYLHIEEPLRHVDLSELVMNLSVTALAKRCVCLMSIHAIESICCVDQMGVSNEIINTEKVN